VRWRPPLARCLRAAAVLAAGAVLAASPGARAADRGPSLEIAPFAGLFWSTQVQARGGTIATGAAADVGATLGIGLAPETGPGPERTGQIELLYAYAQPRTTFQSTSAAIPGIAPFTIRYQYFQAGGVAGFPQDGFEPFASAGVGAVWLSPSGVNFSDGTPLQVGDTWLFAASLGGGVKWFFSRTLGLRFAARFYFPIFFQSAAFLSGPGGAALTVNAGVPLVQGDLTVGLIIAP
jgi:hypothetical protein